MYSNYSRTWPCTLFIPSEDANTYTELHPPSEFRHLSFLLSSRFKPSGEMEKRKPQ